MMRLIRLHFLLPGDIGGQMGLFIGASILTILELFDYLYEVRLLQEIRVYVSYRAEAPIEEVTAVTFSVLFFFPGS